MAIRSNELRHTATFQRRGSERNDYGEPVGAWAQLVIARAAVDPIDQTQEIFQALQLTGQESARIRCRYQSALRDVTTADRIVIGLGTARERVYDIRAVIEPETAHKEMHFIVVLHS